MQVHASAAKAAIDSITRSLALEWGNAGIRVNGIAPGPIEGTAGRQRVAGLAVSTHARVKHVGREQRGGGYQAHARSAVLAAGSPSATDFTSKDRMMFLQRIQINGDMYCIHR